MDMYEEQRRARLEKMQRGWRLSRQARQMGTDLLVAVTAAITAVILVVAVMGIVDAITKQAPVVHAVRA